LPVGEVLDTGEQGAADPVERVVLVSTTSERGQLDTASDLVECVARELDDVEGIEDCDRFGQLVMDRVAIPAERVQRGAFDRHGDLDPLLLEPVGVARAGPALHGIEQPHTETPVGAAGEVDHHRDGLVGRGDPAGPPDVLVHPDRLHPSGTGLPATSGSRVTSRTCMPSTPNNSSVRAHHDAPGPHVQLRTPGLLLIQLLGRY
jgi:hypothetical protein